MSLNSDCGCNDYAKLTGNTGIVTISVANSNLDGTGAMQLVCTGAQEGTIIKSLIIKALGQVNTGMVRFFIYDGTSYSLFREVPIPTYPEAYAIVPPFIYPMLEIDLIDVIKLAPNVKLFASTQNAESFNIIAEGLNWSYPDPIPDVCCNFMQTTALTGIGTASVANPFLTVGGTIVNVFQAPAGGYGSAIKSITIAALQSTLKGMVRLFIGPNPASYKLWMEVLIPETVQSGIIPSFKVALKEDFHVQPGMSVGASTQLAQSFAVTVAAEEWSYPI